MDTLRPSNEAIIRSRLDRSCQLMTSPLFSLHLDQGAGTIVQWHNNTKLPLFFPGTSGAGAVTCLFAFSQASGREAAYALRGPWRLLVAAKAKKKRLKGHINSSHLTAAPHCPSPPADMTARCSCVRTWPSIAAQRIVARQRERSFLVFSEVWRGIIGCIRVDWMEQMEWSSF